MNFGTPAQVLDTIRASDEVERTRGINRTKINDLANGVPPLSDEAAKKYNLRVNVNFGEGPMLFANGRRQYESAFLSPQNYFKVTIPQAPPEKATEWGMTVTRELNRILKDSEDYVCTHEYKWSSVLLHGVGATIWHNDEGWTPEFVAIEDLRVATDTTTSFKNLAWFAVRRQYTVGELSRKVFGEHADPGWNQEPIQKALDALQDINYEASGYTWMTSPEKMAELVKQSAGYYSSDACPSITLWHFYYYDEENPKKCAWKLLVVPDVEAGAQHITNEEFLYQSDQPVAQELKNLLHVQFGDLNNKPPFMYHSIRSLGFLLVEPCYWTNLARCRYLQHIFEHFNIWLRSTDPGGRARAQSVQLFDRCFIPEGVSIVPQTERPQINEHMVESGLAQLKQLMTEASQSYVQNLDTGTKKEQTAFETRVKLEAVNSMMTGLLGRGFRKEKFAYQEIARRFCLRKSEDPDVRQFQKAMKRAGIPPLFLNVDFWVIEPEIPMGAGNPTMAQTQSQQLWALRGACDPTTQQEILHETIEVITGDPRRAERWAPIGGQRGVTDAQRDSEFAFGTLMQGVQVRLKEGISAGEQIETLLGLLGGKISQLGKMGGMASKQEIAGLLTVMGYCDALLKQLSQDEQQKDKVKLYADALGKLHNAVKAFAQRLAEQAKAAADQNGNGIAPEVQGKIAAQIIGAKAAAKIKEEKSTQQARHKEVSFVKDQQRKDAEAIADQHREAVRAGAEVERQRVAQDQAGESGLPNGET